LEYRTLGKTGLRVSALGFGCGGVGGIMVADQHRSIVRAVERAVGAGINYFDTAQIYGDGKSEENLGRVLQETKSAVYVGTKVQLTAVDMDRIEARIIRAAETSLRRLRREQLDLFQLHNPIGLGRCPEKRWIGVGDLPRVAEAFQNLQTSGKIRYWGINGIGETEAIIQGLANDGVGTVQVCYNLLNPSAWYAMPMGFPFQDYGGLIKTAVDMQVGVIAFRILAGGALSGRRYRHPTAAKFVEPIATSKEYALDVALSKHFQVLVDENWCANIIETAIRFALSRSEISTMPVGFSSLDQLEQAIGCVEKGPLPDAALERLMEIWKKSWPVRM